MKFLTVFFLSFLLLSSCQTKKEHQLLLKDCDELDIVFFSKDTFVFKTFDTSTINNFVELITTDNETFTDTCEITEQLIFKNRGDQIFSAGVSTKNIKSCNSVSYYLGSKIYKHKLTYRTGMGIDEIYWHKIDPQGNPWTGLDTTKFRYEDFKNNR